MKSPGWRNVLVDETTFVEMAVGEILWPTKCRCQNGGLQIGAFKIAVVEMAVDEIAVVEMAVDELFL